jgi:hypothetical protein
MQLTQLIQHLMTPFGARPPTWSGHSSKWHTNCFNMHMRFVHNLN